MSLLLLTYCQDSQSLSHKRATRQSCHGSQEDPEPGGQQPSCCHPCRGWTRPWTETQQSRGGEGVQTLRPLLWTLRSQACSPSTQPGPTRVELPLCYLEERPRSLNTKHIRRLCRPRAALPGSPGPAFSCPEPQSVPASSPWNSSFGARGRGEDQCSELPRSPGGSLAGTPPALPLCAPPTSQPGLQRDVSKEEKPKFGAWPGPRGAVARPQ